MLLKYDEIYSQFYMKETDPIFFQLSPDDAYEMMRRWLHSIVALPYIRKCFSDISFDDELMTMNYNLVHPVDEASDEDFVKEMFAQGMLICWLQPKVESIENITVILGTKEEKRLQSNYKATIDRLNSLETKLKKYIRDYGYINNSYIRENS